MLFESRPPSQKKASQTRRIFRFKYGTGRYFYLPKYMDREILRKKLTFIFNFATILLVNELVVHCP